MSSLTGRVKRTILEAVQRAGYDVHKRPGSVPPYRLLRRLRLGRDPLADIRTILGSRITSVFDVGAHIGQTAARLVDAFPHARIHSFEPDPHAFAQLREFARTTPRIEPVNAAVGDTDGRATFYVNAFDQTSSLLRPAPGAQQYLLDGAGLAPREQVDVPVITLDRFCLDRGIDRIDVLKLDAQGYELRILDGARTLLNRTAVPLIYLEVCFVAIYEGQPLFPDVYGYLFERGYRMVWLYESSFHTHLYSLGANAIFIHEGIGVRGGSVPAGPGLRAGGSAS